MKNSPHGSSGNGSSNHSSPQAGETTITIDFITRKSCRFCHQILAELIVSLEPYEDIRLRIFDLDQSDALPKGRQKIITPAIWVEDRLWFLGTFDAQKFQRKLQRMVSVIRH